MIREVMHKTAKNIRESIAGSSLPPVPVEITFDGYMPPDEAGDNTTFEYEDKFKISWKLTDKVRLYNLGEVSKLQGKGFYKGKIGIEITL